MARKEANRNTTKYNIERQYIVFFDSEIDLSWNESDVVKFRQYWKDGISVLNIAETFNRTPLEVVLLMFDLAEQDLIELRPTGIYGL